MKWNLFVLSTAIAGTIASPLQVLPAKENGLMSHGQDSLGSSARCTGRDCSTRSQLDTLKLRTSSVSASDTVTSNLQRRGACVGKLCNSGSKSGSPGRKANVEMQRHSGEERLTSRLSGASSAHTDASRHNDVPSSPGRQSSGATLGSQSMKPSDKRGVSPAPPFTGISQIANIGSQIERTARTVSGQMVSSGSRRNVDSFAERGSARQARSSSNEHNPKVFVRPPPQGPGVISPPRWALGQGGVLYSDKSSTKSSHEGSLERQSSLNTQWSWDSDQPSETRRSRAAGDRPPRSRLGRMSEAQRREMIERMNQSRQARPKATTSQGDTETGPSLENREASPPQTVESKLQDFISRRNREAIASQRGSPGPQEFSMRIPSLQDDDPQMTGRKMVRES